MINATPVRPPSSPSNLGPTAAADTPQTTTSPDSVNSSSGKDKKAKRKIPLKYLLGALVLLILILGGIASFYLTQMNQDVRQQAYDSGATPGTVSSCTDTCSGSGSGTAVCSCPSGCVKTGPIVSGQTCGGPAGSFCDNDPCQPGFTCDEANDRCIDNRINSTCPAGSSPINGGVDAGACRCPSGDIVDRGSTCPTVTPRCSNYTNQAQCNQSADNLDCAWSHATNSCITSNAGGSTCPAGSSPINGGVDAGACRCNNTGQVIERDGRCPTDNPSFCDNDPCRPGFQCIEARDACVSTNTNLPSFCDNDPCRAGFRCDEATDACISTTGSGSGTGGSTNPPPTGGTCTANAGQRCGSNGQCCANGGVCQGTTGQEVCQIPSTSPAQQCANGGGTCTGWYGFKCTSLTASGECLSNGQRFSSRSSATSYAGSCGQVDQVCVGGSNDGKLCGDFTIFNQCSGGGGTPPPGTTPTPTPPTDPEYSCNSSCTSDAQCQTDHPNLRCLPTQNGNRCRLPGNPTATNCQPPTGPQCLNISMAKAGAAETPSDYVPKMGDALTFTCGTVAGADHYVFRVVEPDGTITSLNATGAVSEPYTISKAGTFRAQCQICTGASDDTCHVFEGLN